MVHFINNIGDYFASNYFDDDFSKKVIEKSGYNRESVKQLEQKIAKLKQPYFKLKERFIENKLRTKDKIKLSHEFHTRVLETLGYDGNSTCYHDLYPVDEKSVLPVRHILYRDNQPHLMIMEMNALIKINDDEPEGLFEQRYSVEDDDKMDAETIRAQKYHRSQWEDIFTVPDGVSVSPMIINKAISQLFLLPQKHRPKFILMCAANQYFLLECEKWLRGSYLQLDLEALFDDAAAQKNFYAVFYLLLAREMLAPNAEMVLLDQLDEDAHKAAYEVTKDLKEGVIHAVEKLANETVFHLKQMGENKIDADKLKDECLNMVYRLLFLFYAESREDLDILPSNDEIYIRGYSLEMLRDLEQVPLVTESGKNGYFFHNSLFQLFNLLNNGFREKEREGRSFKLRHLDSPMFNDKQLIYLNKIKIRNFIWQDVICELSLSKKQKDKNRGRISYANLGINQLGSVYESLLAFRGFLAESDYIEVHRKRKKGESSEKVVRADGSYLVPRYRLGDFEEGEVYKEEKADGTEELKIIPQGTFIYRLNGRDRQKSASYYTPEVLTQTTVKYTLKPILERLEKKEIRALDLLNLKILEPAMGAAAFHNEVINQLAEVYLTYRQQELKKRVEPDKYHEELQKIKAYIALNNVYGVDLNPTAIELGKLSLWLNVIHKDMHTPFFGYRLGIGNAVVGSWLKVFKHKDFSFEPIGQKSHVKKEWWNVAPKHLKFGKKGILRGKDEIYHFLLPDKGMVSSANIRLLKDTYPDEARHVTEWRKEFCSPIRGDEFERLQRIAKAIDTLLLQHYEIQKNISLITESNTPYFGNPKQTSLDFHDYSYNEKESFARERLEPNAPYYKLKQIMDYWCSLWFWDVRNAKDLPSRREWYDDLEQILNINFSEETLSENEDEEEVLRDYRKDKKELEKQLVDALKQSTFSLFDNERAKLIRDYVKIYRFFHYELEFIEVFRENNGFDIAVGNPPWLKVVFEEKGLMSDIYPELEIRKITAPQIKKLQADFLINEDRQQIYFAENIESDVSAIFMNAYQNYPLLKGQQTDLYKCVLENGLHWINENGFLGLIHPEGIYDDPKGGELRKVIYKRLKFHFQFKNELNLFSEVHHETIYGIHIYSGIPTDIDFISINNLFHPSTINGCFIHNGFGTIGGEKVKNENTGKMEWNIIPHRNRLLKIKKEILEIFAKAYENSDDWQQTKLIQLHGIEENSILKKFANFKTKVSDFENKISEGWHETNDVNIEIIRNTIFPKMENFEMIYSGPHFFVANPIYKSPKESCILNSDYDVVNPLVISEDFLPRTNYTPLNVTAGYASSIKGFELSMGVYDNWFDYYKVGFRKMLSKGERTLTGCLIAPNISHVNGVISLIFKDKNKIIEFAGLSSSIIYDYYIKTLGASNLTDNRVQFLPLGIEEKFKAALFVRTLQLNCLNKYYALLWEENYQEEFKNDNWSFQDNRLKSFSSLTPQWTWKIPLRNYFERRMALVEIDVISAMALGINLQELIMMYNIRFSILQQNEDDTWYDTKGNIVFTCSKGLVGVGLDRSDWERIKDMQAGETYAHSITKSELYQGEKVIYYAPFTKCDRVEDYKLAWGHFEKRFKED